MVGETFARGDALMTVHAADEQAWQAAQQRLLGAMTFDGELQLPDAVVGHVVKVRSGDLCRHGQSEMFDSVSREAMPAMEMPPLMPKLSTRWWTAVVA